MGIVQGLEHILVSRAGAVVLHPQTDEHDCWPSVGLLLHEDAY
eukprot:CAMPEP_0113517212 /NCGR_PEP_ID=MMETSP0014_2-20120614/42078_1 /TAXON_ID=2857 /ORGANISM="Nitzschia sp." /LENGTH=42 /DNA_ID=CAMNT_0000414273 /DNA_START=56 /DNA_END=181 /DNA_ORIENTATION=- /assembly_acc=CAM_ASM_000159